MRALIVAHGPELPPEDAIVAEVQAADIVIAADGGAAVLLAIGLTPDVVVGDLDSTSVRARALLESAGVPTLAAPVDKDVSDLDLALSHARESGVDRLVLLGATGGRLDHTLAALGSLAAAADLRPRIVGDTFSARILSPPGVATASFVGPLAFSLIALGGPAIVSCRGAKWGLDHATLQPLSTWGLSNEVIDGRTATADIHSGTVLAYEMPRLSA